MTSSGVTACGCDRHGNGASCGCHDDRSSDGCSVPPIGRYQSEDENGFRGNGRYHSDADSDSDPEDEEICVVEEDEIEKEAERSPKRQESGQMCSTPENPDHPDEEEHTQEAKRGHDLERRSQSDLRDTRQGTYPYIFLSISIVLFIANQFRSR